ncbi:23S rRNA (uracil(1939)-C(5))-methyltransferase RlmD [Paenibacillus sp. GSMTC-2017]|uniref:23S rRNA (uracil(1939)-C(5))-methyltransferase RlmD n=1 Tax=Paenibacillus sp. GSMTC-2017 TaxID=2794350 RepID=UPI0018D5A9CD|nr:23S rRNA (uracil(1939)-C(5))-methyltransferase RlmD [Paenibacillus sp. GSMTC-2017]MBH5319025.1 23S rRNA (uracil(1939)-C(5))-methyltransferase RlmD [Paenibacillus sp. GSMTC-2017]
MTRKTSKGARNTKAVKSETNAPFLKNEELTVDIIGLTHDGEGVGRANGFTLFVQGALPGESARVRVMKLKKQYGYAKLLELTKKSEDRLNPPCDIFKECGGCQLQHFDYEAQLAWKRQHVVDNLKRIGKLQVEGEGSDSGQVEAGTAGKANIAGITVLPTVGMSDPWRYRNKAAVPVGASQDSKELIAGFFARGSHRIIDMDDCLIQHDDNDEVIRAVKRIGRELRIPPYNEETGQGVLRHVMARTGVVTGEMMIVLITNGKRLPRQPEWIEHIRKALPNVKSIIQNVNERDTNVIFGDETRVLWGSEVIYDELDGIRFAISARSFYQVNPEQTVALYRTAVEYAGLTGVEKVIDAYCGIGTISLFLARQAGHVYGVEIVPEAIEDAKRNAKLNGIENASFEAGPAEVVIPRWRKEGIEADVIVVDPPRKGCDPALLETILEIRPERVVYVSCNPSTLARDLRTLEDGGYRTEKVTPVDMFPWTVHVESVALLTRNS